MIFTFAMLLHSLLLTILMPVALGAPVSPTPPTLSLVNTRSDAVNATQSLSESGVDRANNADLHLQGHRGATGSETSSKNRGTPSHDAHSAHGTGVGKGTWDHGKLPLNNANKMNQKYKGITFLGESETSGHAAQSTGVSSTLVGLSGGTAGGASGGTSSGAGGTTTSGSHSTT